MERPRLLPHRYDVETGEARAAGDQPIRPFLSSVDNGWLAAALIMVGNARPRLRDRADALLGPMDFGFFYVPFDPADPVDHPGQFRGGYYPDDRTFARSTGCSTPSRGSSATSPSPAARSRPSTITASSARSRRTEGRSGRSPGASPDRTSASPVFEGHYEYRGLEIVPSWGGSMFEALMVPLFVPEERGPRGAGASTTRSMPGPRSSKALEVMRLRLLGLLALADARGGLPDLRGGRPRGRGRGLSDLRDRRPTEAVASRAGPRGRGDAACFVPGAPFAPGEAMANLRALVKAFPILGPRASTTR